MEDGAQKTIIEDIEHLTSLNIGIVPLSKEMGNIRDVKIGQNSKTDFKPIGLLINKNLYNPDKLRDAINDDIIGFYLETGKRSNISVIDWDLKETTNNDFLNKLKEQDTLTISTAGGGFHFIFKYNENLKNRIGVFKNIDIKNDEQITFFGIREDGIYSIIDRTKEIKEVSPDIIKEIDRYKKTGTQNNEISKYNPDINDKDLSDIIDIKKGFDITEKELYNLLKDLPFENVDKYGNWIETSYILKKWDFGKVWNRWSKHSPKYNKEENIKIYNSLDISKEYRDLNYFINILNKTTKYKNNMLNRIQKIYKRYKPINKENEAFITDKINDKYLNKNLYKSGVDCVIWSGLGTGKSKSVKDYINQTNNKVLSITLLSETINGLYQSFRSENPMCVYYKDLEPSKELKAQAEEAQEERFMKGDYQKSKEEEDLEKHKKEIMQNINKNSIFITIDSILNLAQYNIRFNEYIVFIDEVHSLIKYLLTCENLKDRRKKLFSYFMNILKNSKQIIMSDGDICDNTINLLKRLNRGSFKFVKNEHKANRGVRCYRENDFLKLIEKMKDDINSGVYFTCPSNTKETANKIKLLLTPFLKNPDDILIYTADEGERIIDINKEWLNKYIIYSPSIVCGLDFNPPFPYNTYSIIEGDNTLNPEEISQQIARNRNINELCLYINKVSNIQKYQSIQEVKRAFERGTSAYKEAFNDLIDTQTSEDGTNIDYKENIFIELLYNLEYNNDILKSSFYFNLFEILKNKGFLVERNLYKSISLERAELKKLKEEMKENGEELVKKYINNDLDDNHRTKIRLDRIIKDLDIPKNKENDLNNHINILRDDKAINKHINIRLLTIKSDLLRLMNKEDFYNEYLEVLYKDKKPLTLILREIFNDYLKDDISIFKYEYSHDAPFLNDEIDVKDYHYHYIKSVIRTKEQKPRTKGNLLGLLNNVIKSLFGRDIINTKEAKITIDKKRVKKYNYSFNEDLFIEHLDLFELSLNNNNKYKYINLIDDIKDKYFNDVEITEKDNEEYNGFLSKKLNEINEEQKSNITEHMKTEETFNKINKKVIKQRKETEKQAKAKKDNKKSKQASKQTSKPSEEEKEEYYKRGLEVIRRQAEEDRKAEPELYKRLDEYRRERAKQAGETF